ncbi:MAG: tRNA preQ1(34) S-adenosylmethionine ribosyltransferase-isomerase QueA [Gammaproteobacteria bacterium]|nr:tRNA preQ1(34) S-adenosylmethionine ribosyltransferase-isomerase QueA [Gammaproteobacteria bacterium]
MKSADFDYQLPEQLIAQKPLKQRHSSRLLLLDPQQQALSDDAFANFETFVESGDLLVLNDTRVFPARLFGHKETGGKVEVLVERLIDDSTLLAHVRSSKSPKAGTKLILEDFIECIVTGRQDEFFVLQQNSQADWLSLLQQYGHMPLPPYIQRDDEENDRERYQTVFSHKPGAVAAPTAGLHFDEEMLQKLRHKGINITFVTLHVGAGTFQPVRVDDVENHIMHAEVVEVSKQVVEQVEKTRTAGGRVVAIGTTVVRSLESAAQSGTLEPFSGDTRLFITPGFEFKVVDAMLTNFHLPRSTLLMLVSAFTGKDFMLSAYRHAVEQEYRFFSYGDAMFIKNKI